ncbi:MAG: hypothetical protein CMN32_16805 [Saprospirales bacterium]|nr:hypothetical protein [Saprospirales bacterium]
MYLAGATDEKGGKIVELGIMEPVCRQAGIIEDYGGLWRIIEIMKDYWDYQDYFQYASPNYELQPAPSTRGATA